VRVTFGDWLGERHVADRTKRLHTKDTELSMFASTTNQFFIVCCLSGRGYLLSVIAKRQIGSVILFPKTHLGINVNTHYTKKNKKYQVVFDYI